MEEAIATLRGGRGVELTCAGRTDRGVHAWGQIVSHAGEPVPLDGLNALLPADIAVLASDRRPRLRRPPGRRLAHLLLPAPHPAVASPFEVNRALHWPHPLDRDALAACAAALVGRHDFTAFTPTETEHVRFDRVILSAEWHRRGDTLEFWITADSFMRHMNRVVVGTMLQVATGGARCTRSSSCSTVGHAKRRGRRPRLTGSTSPRSTSARRRCRAASAAAEEQHERDDRQREQHRVDDGATSDRDDQQDDGQDEQHVDLPKNVGRKVWDSPTRSKACPALHGCQT